MANYRRSGKGWILLIPTLSILLFISAIPFAYVIYLSFLKYNVYSTRVVFNGVENFKRLAFDSIFLNSLRVGLTFVAIACSIEMILGLGIALLLAHNFIGKGVVRTVLALPLLVAPIAVGSLWVLMTNPDISPISYTLKRVNLVYNIGNDPNQAFLTTIIMDVWHWTPFVALTLMAGLLTLPQSAIEAAKIDGASRWQTLRYISLPLIKPVILVALFIRIMDTFRIFDEIWMLTSGGPGTATRMASIHLVRFIITRTEYGEGAAISLFLLFLTIVMCGVLLKIVTVAKRQLY